MTQLVVKRDKIKYTHYETENVPYLPNRKTDKLLDLMAVQVTTCKGGGILWQLHYRPQSPHSLSYLLTLCKGFYELQIPAMYFKFNWMQLAGA